ncbi:hypothetical protein CLU79DRAFT_736949 [Phycomyces nitens]|nr:hypothetical protein CLU79DRAFT_736949 [Phycomyces nitens]
MPLQSVIKKKAWRPQALSFLASSQVMCKNCLSQYVSPTPNLITTRLRKSTKTTLRLWASTLHSQPQLLSPASIHSPLRLPRYFSSITDSPKELHLDLDPVDRFRLALYPKKQPLQQKQKTKPVQKILARRKRRLVIFDLYSNLKNRRLLGHLSHEDFRTLVSVLMSNPDNLQTKRLVGQAISVLQDLKQLSTEHAHLYFSLVDVETLVELYREIDAADEAARLLKNIHLLGIIPTEKSYGEMIAILAKTGDMESAEGWLKTMKASGVWPPSTSTIGSMVQGWMGLGNETAALDFLREHPGDALQNIDTTMDDQNALLDMALDVFFNDSLQRWRLNDCRTLYRLKKSRGYSTKSLLRRLTHKSIHTFQTTVASRLLKDTIDLKDSVGCGIVAGIMIKYFISTKNLATAVKICAKADELPTSLSVEHYTILLRQLSHAHYHTDLMIIYRQFYKKYPKSLDISLFTTVIFGLTKAKQYKNTLLVLKDLRESIPDDQLDDKAFLAMYTLCAQAGYLDIFKQVFSLNKTLERPLTHKAYTSLMACYVTVNDPVAAKAVFQAIVSETKGPDTVDFNLLIRATALEKTDGDPLEKIFEIIRHMKTADLNPDQTTLRTLLGIYKNGNMTKMLLAKLASDPDATHSDNIWLNNLSLTRLLEFMPASKVAALFLSNKRSNLLASKTGPIEADGMTYQILIDALTKSPANAQITEVLYKHIRSRGHKLSQALHSQIILVWARKGRLAKARKMIQRMEEETGEKADVNVFSMLISGYLAFNQRENAQRVIDEDLVKYGLVPDQRLLDMLSDYDKKANLTHDHPLAHSPDNVRL